jgi:hypothetical protein
MIAKMQNEFKITSSIYSKTCSAKGGAEVPNWFKISKLLVLVNKPFQFVMETFANIAPRIASIVLELSDEIDQRLLATCQSHRKGGILSLVPEMSGVTAPDTDENV